MQCHDLPQKEHRKAKERGRHTARVCNHGGDEEGKLDERILDRKGNANAENFTDEEPEGPMDTLERWRPMEWCFMTKTPARTLTP